MDACRRWRGHSGPGAGLAVNIRGAIGGTSAVPASSDREIGRFAAATCSLDYPLRSAILHAAQSRSTQSKGLSVSKKDRLRH